MVAPLLVPRFTKLLHRDTKIYIDGKINDLFALLRFEIITASLIALILNILWVPVIDFITQGKYGAVNRYTILVLSACMPFIYANNFLWSIHFSQGRLKMIFYILFITFLVNVTGDIILIPFFDGEGAAFAYLAAILLQFIMFRAKTDFINLKQNIVFVICPAITFLSGYLSYHTFDNTWWQLISALLIFFFLLIFSRLISRNDWSILRRILQF